MSDGATSSDADSDEQLRLTLSGKTPRQDWPERFRRVVEYFEATEDLSSFESGGRYPHEADPFVLHARHEAPLRPGADREYNWSILLNPWPGQPRDAWIMDGRPLLPKETVHGADDPATDLIANDKDLVEVYPYRVVVCVALTKVAEMHTRGETWVHGDDDITEQFEAVLDELES